MAKEINKMIIELLNQSQKTVYKLYKFTHEDKDYVPNSDEIDKFKRVLIHSIKRNKEKAIELFPIIKYVETKFLKDDDIIYDDSIFSVKLDDKISIASPFEVLDKTPSKDEYDLKILWDIADLEERESAVYQAAYNYFQLIKNDKSIEDFLEKIGLYDENFWDLVLKENEIFAANVSQEVFSLHQTDDLNYLLPIELAQLDDPDLEILFYKSFIEKKLLSYQLWGIEREIFEDYELFKKKKENFGDLIICLDTSGSMRGINEVVSKGFTLAIVNLLQQKKIPFIFCTFGTKPSFIDLRKNVEGKQLKIVSKHLQKSFYGGTDFDALNEEIFLNLKSKNFSRANVLVISDFTFKILSNKTKSLIDILNNTTNIYFHGLQITDKVPFENSILKKFKTSWSYSFIWNGVPYTNDELINEITNFNNYSSLDSSSVHTFGILKMMSGKKGLDSYKKDQEEFLEKMKESIEEASYVKEQLLKNDNPVRS